MSDEQAAEPRIEYARRREARLTEAGRQMRRFRRVGIARLASLIAAIVSAWAAFRGLSLWWSLAPAISFLVLAIVQQRITQTRRRAERAAGFYEQGLARLDDAWAGRGATGERFLDHSHPYAADLDLFGHGSLFEMLSIARTRVGEETLARWLLAPATPEVVRARHEAIVELRLRLDLREDLALLAAGVRTGDDALALAAWAAAAPWRISRSVRTTATLLPLLTIVGVILWVTGFGALPLLAALMMGQVFAFGLRIPVKRVTGTVDRAGRGLRLLSEVLSRLERERFSSPLLVELRAALDVEGVAPSRQIAKLDKLIDLLDARRNAVFAIFAMPLLWETQFAIRIESWRQTSGRAVALWLNAVGELEALGSLAGYAYEHPHDPFPEIINGSACFDGEGIGHPLLPESRAVRTDLRLSDDLRLLVVSGSNMSGKSTLLRTVGTNAVLALAGAPVRARRMRISVIEVGASIRIQDSLQAGASRFYAEITRLRQIVELTRGARPVLFLLDEILSGTNSLDRRAGAAGVVRALVERAGIGLITTHDLALAQIADELAPRAANVHFEDHLEAGKMTFDYELRSGVVRRSNALELMRSVGLDV